MKIKSIKSDPKKEQEGIWLPYMDTDIEFKIARSGNPEFEKNARRLRTEAKAAMKHIGRLNEREARKAIAPAVAEFLLVDWRQLQDDDDKDIPYSREKAVELLVDPELHDFYDWVLIQSNNQENFRADLEAEVKGN